MKTSSPKEPALKRVKRRLSSVAARGMRATLERTSVQRIYESLVWSQIQGGPIPEHIGVILDGNRRFGPSILFNCAEIFFEMNDEDKQRMFTRWGADDNRLSDKHARI